MSNELKLKLAISIKKLMKSQPLDKISVKEIVNETGVSRQSFYRNFKDKYELVNWYFDILAMQSFNEMGKRSDLESALVSKFDFIRSEAIFFTQAFRSTDYNSIIKHDYEYILDFYTKKLQCVFQDKMPFEIEFLLQFYCHASISMTVDWVFKGMQTTSEDMADLLIRALPPELKHEFSDLL